MKEIDWVGIFSGIFLFVSLAVFFHSCGKVMINSQDNTTKIKLKAMECLKGNDVPVQ